MKMSCQSTNITLRSFFILKPLQDNKVNGLFMDQERVYTIQIPERTWPPPKKKNLFELQEIKTVSVMETFSSNIKLGMSSSFFLRLS